MKEIKLTQGFVTMVDDEDFENLTQYKWHVVLNRNGKPGLAQRTVKFYKNGKLKNKTIIMHRQILGLEDYNRPYIDHKNRNPLDNQKRNLRIATVHQNNCNKNKPKNNVSLYKGVSFNKQTCKWRAYISKDWKQIYLGGFQNKKDAAIAYNKKAKELFGEYACLNVI